ncbi:MAG: GTP-binding protein [Promethearchaeota archaeon]
MIDIVLTVWDLGGQKRFNFLKEQYFKGAAAVALVFDVVSPDSFKELDEYLNKIRAISGSIPILLVGNKKDLEEEIGTVIPMEDISAWMRQHQITDFMKTSAKTGSSVDDMFKKLSEMAIIDLHDTPRLGEYSKNGVFRFKVLLVGAAGVGKTSLTHRFAEGVFKEEYSLTVGVDFLTKKISLDLDILPEEVIRKIKTVIETQLQMNLAGSGKEKGTNVKSVKNKLNMKIIEKLKLPQSDSNIKDIPADYNRSIMILKEINEKLSSLHPNDKGTGNIDYENKNNLKQSEFKAKLKMLFFLLILLAVILVMALLIANS